MVIFRFSGVFWSFYGFQGYFGHFLCFGGILVIFGFLGYVGYFLDFRDILVIFGGIGVILLIFWVSGVFWSFFRLKGVFR